MGFFDKIMDIATNLGNEHGIGEGLINGITDLFKEKKLGNLAETFREQGLGDIFSSWVGKGENQSISSEQIQNILGEDKIRDIAEKAGLSQEETPALLQKLIPDIIDKITPDGEIEEEDDEYEEEEEKDNDEYIEEEDDDEEYE